MAILYVCGHPPAPAMAMEEPGKEVKNSPSTEPACMVAPGLAHRLYVVQRS